MANRSLPELSFLSREIGDNDLFLIRGFTENQDYKLTPVQLREYLADMLAGTGLSVNDDGEIQLGDGQTIYFTPKGPTHSDGNFYWDGDGGSGFYNELFGSEMFHTHSGAGPTEQVQFYLGGYYDNFEYAHYIIGKTTPTKGELTLYTNGNNGGIGTYNGAYIDFDSDVTRSILTFFAENIASGIQQLTLRTNGVMLVTDSILDTGFVYDDDYSAAGTLLDRWIPDWKAVKDYVAANSSGEFDEYFTFVTGTPLYQMGFENDFYQFLAGVHSFDIGGHTALQFSVEEFLWQDDVAQKLFGISDSGIFIQSNNTLISDDGTSFLVSNAEYSMLLQPDTLSITGEDWQLVYNEFFQFKMNSTKGLAVKMLESLGQEVVAFEPIDGVNTDAFLVSKPVYEGTAETDKKLMMRSEVVTEIQTEVPVANQNQFVTSVGVTTHVSDYNRKTTFEVNFIGSAIHATEFHPTTKKVSKPIYELELNFSKENALIGSQAIIYHTAQVVPASLVPFGPKSLRAAYTDTTAMVAGQSLQTIGQYYTVDGITFYRLDAKTGVIGDYTTFSAVAGGEPWGTKPAWLIIQGDAYLTGVDNLNIITATYHEDIKIGSDWYFDVVVVDIKAKVNGNRDLAKPDLDTLVLCTFNENETVDANSVQNTCYYGGSVFTPEVVNPTLGMVYDSLGGSNYAIRRTVTDFVVNNGAWIRILVSSLGNRILNATTEITIIARIRFQDHSTDPSDIPVCGNINAESTQGFALSRRLVSSEGRLRLRIYDGVGLISIDSTSGNILRGNHYYTIGVTYKWTAPNTRVCKMWLKSVNAGYPRTLILNQTTTQTNPPILGSGLPINLMGLFSAPASSRLVAHDDLRIFDRALPDATMESLVDTIDG
jgi:hypothetical protein